MSYSIFHKCCWYWWGFCSFWDCKGLCFLLAQKIETHPDWPFSLSICKSFKIQACSRIKVLLPYKSKDVQWQLVITGILWRNRVFSLRTEKYGIGIGWLFWVGEWTHIWWTQSLWICCDNMQGPYLLHGIWYFVPLTLFLVSWQEKPVPSTQVFLMAFFSLPLFW